MSNYANLPAPSPEAGLSRYLTEIRKFPMLSRRRSICSPRPGPITATRKARIVW